MQSFGKDGKLNYSDNTLLGRIYLNNEVALKLFSFDF